MKHRLLILFALIGFACSAPPAPGFTEPRLRKCLAPEIQEWALPSELGPVLVGIVRDPEGRPLPNVLITPHAGFATRFPGKPTRTDESGRYRFDPILGSHIEGEENGGSMLYVGICFGEHESGRIPGEVLPWRDLRISNQPGVVKRFDFTFDSSNLGVVGQER